MTIRAHNGVGIIEGNYLACTYLGTSGEGEFPPIGQAYDRFTFKPKRGVPGILVFRSTRSVGEKLTYFQYYWEGKKLFIYDNEIGRPTNAFSYSEDMEFVVRYRDHLLVTRAPDGAMSGPYRLVELFTMLRYIEGKITIHELVRSGILHEQKRKAEAALSERLAAAQTEAESLKGYARELETRMKLLETEVEKAAHIIEKLGRFAKYWLPTLLTTWPVHVRLVVFSYRNKAVN